MNLTELAAAGEAAAQTMNADRNVDAAVLQIVVVPTGDDSTVTMSMAASEDVLGPVLTRIFKEQPDVRALFEKALRMADDDCDCPACQIRRALESGQGPSESIKATAEALLGKRIKNDPSIN